MFALVLENYDVKFCYGHDNTHQAVAVAVIVSPYRVFVALLLLGIYLFKINIFFFLQKVKNVCAPLSPSYLVHYVRWNLCAVYFTFTANDVYVSMHTTKCVVFAERWKLSVLHFGNIGHTYNIHTHTHS